jgi:hypothetical protein
MVNSPVTVENQINCQLLVAGRLCESLLHRLLVEAWREHQKPLPPKQNQPFELKRNFEAILTALSFQERRTPSPRGSKHSGHSHDLCGDCAGCHRRLCAAQLCCWVAEEEDLLIVS